MNVKAGDLAILIKSAANNEGKVCKAISFVGYFLFRGGNSCNDAWLVEFPRPVTDRLGLIWVRCYVSDAWLRPISGLPIDEDARTEEKVPA